MATTIVSYIFKIKYVTKYVTIKPLCNNGYRRKLHKLHRLHLFLTKNIFFIFSSIYKGD